MRYVINADYTTVGALPSGPELALTQSCSSVVTTCCLGLLEANTLNFLILFVGLAADSVLWTWNVVRILSVI